jgi:hypothetical protein
MSSEGPALSVVEVLACFAKLTDCCQVIAAAYQRCRCCLLVLRLIVASIGRDGEKKGAMIDDFPTSLLGFFSNLISSED